MYHISRYSVNEGTKRFSRTKKRERKPPRAVFRFDEVLRLDDLLGDAGENFRPLGSKLS